MSAEVAGLCNQEKNAEGCFCVSRSQVLSRSAKRDKECDFDLIDLNRRQTPRRPGPPCGWHGLLRRGSRAGPGTMWSPRSSSWHRPSQPRPCQPLLRAPPLSLLLSWVQVLLETRGKALLLLLCFPRFIVRTPGHVIIFKFEDSCTSEVPGDGAAQPRAHEDAFPLHSWQE